MSERASATAFAPASVANVAVGFDMLGHSVSVIGDRVSARRVPEPTVRITSIEGCETELPREVERNTATRAAASLMREARTDFGLEIDIYKGIPLESGLGGSAASAVAAVVAANALLPSPLQRLDLLRFALDGEEAASGARHLDNVAASLLGGLVLVIGVDAPRVVTIPVPSSLRCVLVHPHLKVSTRQARTMLREVVPLHDCIRQNMNLAGFLAGCYTGDLDVIKATFEDVIVEPQRRQLIPGFGSVKARALAEGALGCSIAGAGPTVFAWAEQPRAVAVASSMMEAFSRVGLQSDSWISEIGCAAAHIIESE